MDPACYFDNAATTPVDPRVFAAMEPYLRDSFGNANSIHAAGREACAPTVELNNRESQDLLPTLAPSPQPVHGRSNPPCSRPRVVPRIRDSGRDPPPVAAGHTTAPPVETSTDN